GHLDGLIDPFDAHRADRPRLDVAFGKPDRLGGGEHRSRLCHLLHPRGDMHGAAHGDVAHVESAAADVEDHFAGVEPDANLNGHAVDALNVIAVVAHDILHA